MGKFAITLLLCLFCHCSFAQKITGRWHCTAETISQCRLGFQVVNCTYKFKKDGTMIIKIKGYSYAGQKLYSGDYEHLYTGGMTIKGRYFVLDGKITSQVTKEDIETYASDIPNTTESDNTPAYVAHVEYQGEDRYRSVKEMELRRRVMDYPFLWDWKDVPICYSGKRLKIGDKLIMR
ncbi:MAG: hypothetical protein E7070_03950 [Bacteroidales bacterium]|nr:hypothetical protein [Bacteroidales bacterium]